MRWEASPWLPIDSPVARYFAEYDWSEYFSVKPWSRRSTCRHEAGHLVAYHEECRMPVHHVAVFPSVIDPEKFVGQVQYSEESRLPPTIETQMAKVKAHEEGGMPQAPPRRGNTFSMQLIAWDLRLAALRAFSGVAAEYPIAGGYTWTRAMSQGSRIDQAGFLHAVMKWEGWARDIDPCWTSLRLARELVDRNWGAIMALETALLKTGELDGETVLRIIDCAPRIHNPFREKLLSDESRKPVGWVVWKRRRELEQRIAARNSE